jgi:tagatose 6-phosphate kinase
MVFKQLAVDAVNRALTTQEAPSGKSINVAKVLRTLGEPVVAVGFLGGDRGDAIAGVLEAEGLVLDFVRVAARTRQCTTLIDLWAELHTELVEESAPAEAGAYEDLISILRRRLPGCRSLVLSGSITPGGPPDFYFRCAQLARESEVFVVVDAQGVLLTESLRAKPALAKPNRAELSATLGRDLRDEHALQAAMGEVHEQGAQRVVVTSGSEPALAFDGRHFWRILPPQIKAANPIGSGDAFTAGLVSRLLRGDALAEACRWGSAAGSANALTLLPGELKKEDLERLAKETRIERVP